MCNSINQKVGKNIDALEMYLMVLYLLNSNYLDYEKTNVKQVYHEIDAILFDNLPLIYSDQCFTVLRFLKKEGATINVLSNTGFISGSTIRQVLKKMGLEDFFDFQIYSDEVGISKPNQEIFHHLVRIAQQYRKKEVLNLKDIIHIGDNPVADYEGALSIGINGLLINSNNVLISAILNG